METKLPTKARTAFEINTAERFPHLARAPIVEAVIHWRAPAGKTLDKSGIQAALTQRFAHYRCQEQQEVGAAIQSSPEGVELRQQTRWNGFRLTGHGEADRYIAQFTPGGLVFSRLAKYDRWDTFQAEAMRFWQAYVELAEAPVIERLGVRFINQVRLGPSDRSATILKRAPAPPPRLGLSGDQFFHQDSYSVTGHPYHINWVRTVQLLADEEKVLIVDIDVSTEPKGTLDAAVLLKRLSEMRYLKNKLFFACMRDQALRQFGKDEDE